MLKPSIDTLIYYLKECLPELSTIEWYDDKVDGGFCGLTDKFTNYAYIRQKPSAKGFRHEISDHCDDEKVTGTFYLIVDLSKKFDKYGAHALIAKKLRSADSGCGIINIITSGDDSDEIYKQENKNPDSGWKDCNNFLLCYEFTLKQDFIECNKGFNQCLSEYLI